MLIETGVVFSLLLLSERRVSSARPRVLMFLAMAWPISFVLFSSASLSYFGRIEFQFLTSDDRSRPGGDLPLQTATPPCFR